VHSDVGGSYPESESQLSKLALRWMLCEAEIAGLLVDRGRKADILGGKPPYVRPDPTTTNQHESLHGWWWIAEVWPKIVHLQTADDGWHKSIQVNLGRRRWISPDVLIHESVQRRLSNPQVHYMPSNLPGQPLVVQDRCANDSTS
jgi:hypothetical protein